MDKLELFSNTLFLLIMSLVIWGLMGPKHGYGNSLPILSACKAH